MAHFNLDMLLGFVIAVGLMAVLWIPLFSADFRAEKKPGHRPAGSGEDAPSAPLDKVHLR